jgi:hypothetical protein
MGLNIVDLQKAGGIIATVVGASLLLPRFLLSRGDARLRAKRLSARRLERLIRRKASDRMIEIQYANTAGNKPLRASEIRTLHERADPTDALLAYQNGRAFVTVSPSGYFKFNGPWRSPTVRSLYRWFHRLAVAIVLLLCLPGLFVVAAPVPRGGLLPVAAAAGYLALCAGVVVLIRNGLWDLNRVARFVEDDVRRRRRESRSRTAK